MKKLPLGIANLNEIIIQGYAYVDKTRFVHELADTGKYYFLSRPRRFGKSLFVDTLKEAFEGNRELFRGLWLEDRWDWGTRHPVISVSLGKGEIGDRQELDRRLMDILRVNQQALGVECTAPEDIAGCFSELIRLAAQKHGQRVVVLVDEYDKPILDNITEPEKVAMVRKGLKNFYSVIKDSDAHLQFVFLTGVSKFSKVSLFSGLNNLTDITLSPRYAAICGWTEAELTATFAEHLHGKDRDEIRRWYNGYSWLGEKVYNPFSLLSYLREGLLRNYWFETATPEFLIRLLMSRRYDIPSIERIEIGPELLGSFDVESIFPETLLFQAGYLTITGQEEILPGEVLYRLNYPNHEVKKSFTEYLLNFFTQQPVEMKKSMRTVVNALRHGQVDDLRAVFHAVFASIPHDWYRKNNLAAYEGYYCSVLYCYFAGLGLDTRPEESTNHGRMDMAVLFENRAYVFEFKVTDLDQTPGSALEQIKRKGYADKYRAGAEAVYLIGVEFEREARNIVSFEWEQMA
ncbi:ATP-binding protein [Desulfonatronum parangueonense]